MGTVSNAFKLVASGISHSKGYVRVSEGATFGRLAAALKAGVGLVMGRFFEAIKTDEQGLIPKNKRRELSL